MSAPALLSKGARLLAALKAPESPFPGLRPFEFDESHLFFGRDRQIEKLIAKLSATHFLAVVGTSGSGKSSLVRAGLLPALRGAVMTGAGSKWRIALLRPGNDPIGSLARALSQQVVFGPAASEQAELQVAITEATLRRGSRGLVETVRQNALPAQESLLVVVDQFEELFRFAREARRANNENYDNEAAAFVKLLLEAVKPHEDGQRDLSIYIVLTMRSDFLGDCAQFWDLPEAINESQYLIPRLTRNQLREVITGPVALCGGEIAPRLINQLLNDIGDNQDQLPILQHALMRTWDEWKAQELAVEVKDGDQTDKKPHADVHQGAAIDLCCYEAIGGMALALSKHADEAFDELPDEHHRRVAEKLFKALTEKGEDNREIRRPVTFGEVCAVAEAGAGEVKTVTETFRRPGRSFLMPPAETPLHADTLIDISHESLIRVWKRLQQWVNEEAEAAAIYHRLAQTARLHQAGKSELWHGADLQAGLEWQERNNPTAAWAQRYDPGFATAVAFLQASAQQRSAQQAAVERRRQEEAERAKRELAMSHELARARMLRRGIIALSVLLVGLAGLAFYSYRESARAGRATIAAEQRRELAEAEHLKALEARAEAVAAQEAARQLAARALAATLKQAADAGDLKQLNAIVGSVARVADNKIEFGATATEVNAAGTSYDKYRFELFPNTSSLPDGAGKMTRVSYILSHESFNYKHLVGTPGTNFKTGYVGWGCLRRIIAIIEYAEPEQAPSISIFDMCEKLGGLWN